MTCSFGGELSLHKVGWIPSTKACGVEIAMVVFWPLMKSNGLAFSRPGAAQVRAT